MDEQLLLGGGSVPVGPPPVPRVVFHPEMYRRTIRSEARRQCGHCLMNVRQFHDDPGSIPEWSSETDITILRAVVLITQVDGSTLELCAQHAQEHQERGNRHG